MAWIDDEPAADRVEVLLEEARTGSISLYMSWINIGEVYYLLAKRRSVYDAEQFLARVPTLPLRAVLPLEEDILIAARLKGTRRLCYADAFAAALAIRQKAPLTTGDPEMPALEDVLTLDWIGA